MNWDAYPTCVDPALECLELLHDKLPQNSCILSMIQSMQPDLRFFKMFFWGLKLWEQTGNDSHLDSVMIRMNALRSELREIAKEFRADGRRAIHRGEVTNWELMSSHLVEKIKEFKPRIRESCLVFLGGSVISKSSRDDGTFGYAGLMADFIDFTVENLEVFVSNVVDLNAPVKQQIGFIIGKLKLFRNFGYLVSQWWNEREKLDELLPHIHTWANHISCLSFLYWSDEMDESLACTMGTMLSDLMQKTMPYSPEVIGLYLDVLKTTSYSKFDIYSKSDTIMLNQVVASYVDFLLENLAIPMKDEIEILREGLVFLLTFVMNPPEDSGDGKLILAQIDAIISEVPSLICSIRFDEKKEDISMSNAKFSDFLQKIDRVRAVVGELYVLIPHSSQSSFPRTNAIGFIDFLLGNLKKMLEVKVNFIPSVKRRIEIFWEELASLRPFLNNIVERQSESEEFKFRQARIINLVYNAEYVINLCSVQDVSVWYNIICLSNVTEEIKLIKIEVKEIEYDRMYNNEKLSAEMESSDDLLPQATTSSVEGVFIAFEEDARSIIDDLMRGTKDLSIVSISGMPGQGKTTLAKRIYNDPSIQYHFHKSAWCYVSKECKRRELLIKILCDVSKVDDKSIIKLETQDLLENLWKSLKGQRYLIIMDDIWDVDVWHEVEGSFPDDRKGSRVMFTSRNHNLASQAKQNSTCHHLRLFSDMESWELIEKKLFQNDGCPPEFLEIGKQIAIYCKGLPLAVELIATLLKRTQQKYELWNKVAENLHSHLASEGCMHIMELSYKYLPDHLKPCFLYFGAFPRNGYIRAQKLMLLWIAEGFVNRNEMQCSEDLAKLYLDNLIDQSLVVVTERSPDGSVKTCTVHDLLFDLCLEKALEENFLQLADTGVVSQCSLHPQKYDHHRLCIGISEPFTQPRTICTRKELPTGQVHSLLWFRDFSLKSSDQSFEFSPFLNSFKVLTVLDLEGLFLNCKFPLEILSIVHLRYLAIWAAIDYIPSSIADLWNLETLIVREPQHCVTPPEIMWKMKSLRHVNIDGMCIDFIESEPDQSFEGYNIETLHSPFLLYDRYSNKFLSRLPNLRKLCCLLSEEFHPGNAIWFPIFGSLHKLESLRVDFCGEVFFGKKSENFPTFNFPENLNKLSLSGFKLPWSAMSTIGKLPNLEVFKLEKEACEGTTWDLEDGEFSKLKFLKLSQLDIEQFNVSSEPFPSLEELVVEYCDKLEEIPSCFGDICTLKTIKVVSSYKASNSARRIMEEQRDMGNDSLQVHIHGSWP